MSIILPPQGHPVREVIDLQHLAMVFAPDNVWLINSVSDALDKARDYLRGTFDGVLSVNVICRHNDHFLLVEIGADYRRTLWNFTTGE